MLRLRRRRTNDVGLPPGSLVHIGRQKTEKETITVIDYDDDRVEKKENVTIAETFPFRERSTPTWIHVSGLHNPRVVQEIGGHYGIHPLVLEDILNTEQRPKVESYENCLFVVLKSIRPGKLSNELFIEQVSVVMGPNFVISFQESDAPIFAPVIRRIENRMGRIRKLDNDYLAYALIDTLVDYYFMVLENMEDEIERVEDALIVSTDMDILHDIYHLKRKIIILRKAVLPLRDLALKLEKTYSPLISKETRLYLTDLYDHVIQIADAIEIFRDIVSDLLGLYHSSINNRMNEVMKVLTIISTTFIPLSFITGLYGMNFEYMPELRWHWGYPAVWGVILLVALCMIGFFKKKNWF